MKFNLSNFLPSSKDAIDFVKIGAGLYLIGLVVMFVYLVQLNVLSIDLIKPQAIVIGLYVWLLADTLPKMVSLMLSKFRLSAMSDHLLFITLLFLVYNLIVWLISGFSIKGVVFAFLMVLAVLVFGGFNSKTTADTPAAPASSSYLLVVVFCVLFSISLFPNIPQYFAGGKPVLVKIFPADKAVFLSQFSRREPDADGMIEADLLYEGGDSYYFIQNVTLDSSDIIFNYRIKKIKKDQVKKIEFTKQNFITFKK